VVVRQIAIAALVLGMLVLAGCIGTDAPLPQNSMSPVTEYGRKQQNLFEQILWPAWFVFIVVEGILLYTIWRFRARPGQPRPRQVHGNTAIEIGWTIAPALVLAYIAVPTVQTIFDIGGDPPPGAMPIQVVAHQWWWEFRYPEQNLVTANEVHLPVGRTVSFLLNSDDVIHSFSFPRLGGKRDVTPTHINHLWLDAPKEPGPPDGYLGQCAEFCGASHANMRMRAFVDSQADFDAWVRQQQAPAAAAGPEVAKGAELFNTRGCAACHTIVGINAQPGTDSEQLLNHNNPGKLGPNLTHVGSRKTIAGGILYNTTEDLKTWLRNPPEVKPGALMPNLNLNEDDIAALVAYLESLK
jgi:cytochrome c oxidase subunit 2